jgi:ABC-2 type transport system ATP-binding protein
MGEPQVRKGQAREETAVQSEDGPIVQARKMTKEFRGETVVEDVTFDLPRGRIFGFIGPSGSGKTTSIRMLTGYYPPSAGEVFVFGKPPTAFTQSMRARIGYMPQLFVLYPHMTVWENLNFAASIYGIPLYRKEKLKTILDLVELYPHRNKLARQISGGMQRRLSLAATLVHAPELIFLDEPTAGVDPVLRQKFWDHFRELRDTGDTLFVTTQYVSEAAYCDLVGIMDEGRLLVVDTPTGLRHRAFGGDMVDIKTSETIDYRTEQRITGLPYVKERVVRTSPNSLRVVVDEASTALPELIEFTRDNNLSIETIEEYQPPFDEVFVELVQGNKRYG